MHDLYSLRFRLPVLALLCVLPAAAQADPVHGPDPAPVLAAFAASAALRDAVTVDGVFEHLQALQRIAEENGGNRAAGTAGYDRSADYVARVLSEAGYTVRFEAFEFPFFRETAPPTLEPAGAAGIGEVRSLAYSASASVTAPLVPVDLGLTEDGPPAPSTSGCEAGDFAGFPADTVALLRRGTCTFQQKVDTATAAGAAGVVIMNTGIGEATGPFLGSLRGPAAIPVVGIDFASGKALATRAATPAPGVTLTVEAESGMRRTRNVIADTPAAPADGMLLVGAHLDSVAEGPGINDNASGVAVTLEVARQLARPGSAPHGPIRFAFWGAEELGLLGSRHHVEDLGADAPDRIGAVLNLDMVGSPNWVPLVYDGDGTVASSRDAPAGSGEIETVLRDYFDVAGVPVKEIALNAASDHAPFAARGIAVGGLYTGADERKSDDSARRWGGTAGAPLDPCYHQACDTLAGISREAVDLMADATAHAVLTLARDLPKERPKGRRPSGSA